MPNKALVVDANILVRAVLGKRVRGVIEAMRRHVVFRSRSAYAEAEEHLPRSSSSAAVTRKRRSRFCAACES